MRIVVDENIPLGREAFSTLGEVVLRPGRGICRADLKEAEILCVRSVTKVDAELLQGTSVRYVATATIGMDHLDTDYLERAGIAYCSAPGCNADSVADYVTAALLWVAQKRGSPLEGKSIGVVGCGNVGSRVVRRARALGMKVLQNDPPLARQSGDRCYVPLGELFQADYITVHTPLTYEGQDATFHLVDEVFLRRMSSGAVLLNTSRGKVVDCQALKKALQKGSIAGAVLDVWEGEPVIDPELVDSVLIATPHIAGYSLEGKTNGTTQVYRQVCRWLGVEPSWDATPLLPANPFAEIHLNGCQSSDEQVLREAVFKVYPIEDDDRALRASVKDKDSETRGRAFDRLRKEYPCRREFSQTTVHLQGGSEVLAEKLRGITFRVIENPRALKAAKSGSESS